MGAAALAGSSLPLDRAFVARQLGFKRPTENSIDSVSNRDHVIDFAYALAMLMQHLSRFGEELVLYTSQEFGFLKLGDAIATGSSLMPQKRNADVAELMRGRTGRAYGLLTQLLTLQKGQPLSYNRDQQEDKELFFQTFDMVLHCVRLVPVLAENLSTDPQRMRAACREGFLEATDAADYLVRKGVPFREAHEAVGGAVRVAQGRGATLAELSLEEWKALHPAFDAGPFSGFAPGTSGSGPPYLWRHRAEKCQGRHAPSAQALEGGPALSPVQRRICAALPRSLVWPSWPWRLAPPPPRAPVSTPSRPTAGP